MSLSITNLFKRLRLGQAITQLSVVCEEDPDCPCGSDSPLLIPDHTLSVEKTTLRIPANDFQWISDPVCEDIPIGDCCTRGNPITVPCCTEPVSDTLSYFVAAAGCSGLTLDTLDDLVYDEVEEKWIGTYTGLALDSFIVRIWCNGTTWTGDIACSTAPTERSTLVLDPDTGDCQPLYLRFDTTIDWVTCSSYFGCTPIINVYGPGGEVNAGDYALRVTTRRARIRVRSSTDEYCAEEYQNCCDDDDNYVTGIVSCFQRFTFRIPKRLYATVTNIVGVCPVDYPDSILSVGDTFPMNYVEGTEFAWNIHHPDPLPTGLDANWPGISFDINVWLCLNYAGQCNEIALSPHVGWSSGLIPGAYMRGGSSYIYFGGCTAIDYPASPLIWNLSFRGLDNPADPTSICGFDVTVTE